MWQCTRRLASTRGTPLIVSLLRLRHQYNRLGTAQARLQSRARGASVQAMSPATTPAMIRVQSQRAGGNGGSETDVAAQEAAEAAAAIKTVEREALRLLDNPRTQLSQLTDVLPTSPLFGVEAGKTLLVAATFGASSEASLVKLLLTWCSAHVSQLQTTRQLMSLCTPLLNLSDGRTAGRAFFFRTFYDPLLAALARVAAGSEASPSATSDDKTMQQHQQCTAIVSVLSLTTRLLTPSVPVTAAATTTTTAPEAVTATCATSDLTPREVERVVRLHMAAARALLCLLSPHTETNAAGGGSSSEADKTIVSVTDCLTYVQSVTRVAHTLRNLSSSSSVTALDELYELCARIAAAVVRHWQPAAVAQSTGLMMRTADVTALLQALRSLDQRALARSLAQTCVALLPATMSSASAKDLCAMLSVVAAVQGDFSDLIDTAAVRRLLDALRPQLFLLAETHRAQLRPLECSQLLQRLSRCETTAAVRVPCDLLGMLCQCFREQLAEVQGGQLVPFLQALARLAVTRRSTADAIGGDAHRCEDGLCAAVQDCVDRAVALERQGMLSALQAARMLHALLDLRSDRSKDLFVVLDRLLQTGAEVADGAIAASEMTMAERAEVVRVLRGFQRQCGGGSDGNRELPHVDRTQAAEDGRPSQTEQGALADYVDVLQAALTQQLTSDVQHDATAAELLSYAATLLVPSAPSTTAAPSRDDVIDAWNDDGGGDDDAAPHADDAASERQDDLAAETAVHCDAAAEALVRRVTAPQMPCSVSEAAQLALTVGTLCAAGHVERGLARAAVRSLLLRRAEAAGDDTAHPTPLPIAADTTNAKRMLDAVRLVDLRDGSAAVQAATAALLQRIATALQDPQLSALSLTRLVALAKTLRAQLGRQRGMPSPACEAAMMRALTALLRHCPRAMRRAMPRAAGSTTTTTYTTADAAAEMLKAMTEMVHQVGQLVHDLREAHRSEDEEMQLPAEESIAAGGHDGDDAEATDAATAPAAAATAQREDGDAEAWRAFDRAVTEALEDMGDMLQRLLTQPCPSTAASLLTSRQVVTLVQGYEQARVVHSGLMAALLSQLYAQGPTAREAGAPMSPLQLSLLLNALLRLGVWNATTMRELLRQIAVQVPRCDVRQCHALLHGLQRTGFLSPQAVVTRGRASADGPAAVVCDGGGSDADVALELLAQDVVWRLDALVRGGAQGWTSLVTNCSLPTLVGVVRALAYFDELPQRTYDTYYALAVRRLRSEVQAYLARGDAADRGEAARRAPALCRVVCGALMLLATLPRVGRHDHRCKLARMLQQCLRSLQTELPVMWRDACQGESPSRGLGVEQLVRLLYSIYTTRLLFVNDADGMRAAVPDTASLTACVLARLSMVSNTTSPAVRSACCRQLRRVAQCLVMDMSAHDGYGKSDARRRATVSTVLQCVHSVAARLPADGARDALQLCDCINHCLCVARSDAGQPGDVTALLVRALSVACGVPTSHAEGDNSTASAAATAAAAATTTTTSVPQQRRWSAHDAAVLFQSCAWLHALATSDAQRGAAEKADVCSTRATTPSASLLLLLPAVSTALQAKDQQLDLPSAVHVLIGGMLLFAVPPQVDQQRVATAVRDGQVMATAHEAWLVAARAASLSLLTALDPTPMRLVALYRLMTFADGTFATCALQRAPQSSEAGEAEVRAALCDVLLRGLVLLAQNRVASPRDKALRLSAPFAQLVAEAVQHGVSRQPTTSTPLLGRVKELAELLKVKALPPSHENQAPCATSA